MPSTKPILHILEKKRGVAIHLPHFLSNRDQIVGDITRNGGIVQSKMPLADIVLLEDGIKENEANVLKKGLHKSKTPCVDKSWLYDSLSKGRMHSWGKSIYKPSYLDLDGQSNPDQLSKVHPNNNMNQRKNRNIFVAADEHLIVQVLAITPSSTSVSRIATYLDRLCEGRHAHSSFYTHLIKNLEKGKYYKRRAVQYRKQQGSEKLEKMVLQFCEKVPEMVEMIELEMETESDRGDNLESEPEANVEEVDATMSEAIDRGIHEERDGKAIECSAEETDLLQSDSNKETAHAMKDIVEKNSEFGLHPSPKKPGKERIFVAKGALKITMQIDSQTALSPVESEAEEEYSRRDASVGAIEALNRTDQAPLEKASLGRKFVREHTDRLIEKLASWLKSIYTDNPSSQDSVIGFLIISQSDSPPLPPSNLFEELAKEIPCHTAEEWHAHFVKQNNHSTYLDLATESLEKMLAFEKETREEEKDKESRLNLETQEKGDGAYEETEVEGATQSQDHIQPANLDFETGSDVDKLEVSIDEEQLGNDEENRNERESCLIKVDEEQDNARNDSQATHITIEDSPVDAAGSSNEVTMIRSRSNSKRKTQLVDRKADKSWRLYIELDSKGKSPFNTTKKRSATERPIQPQIKRRRRLITRSDSDSSEEEEEEEEVLTRRRGKRMNRQLSSESENRSSSGGGSQEGVRSPSAQKPVPRRSTITDNRTEKDRLQTLSDIYGVEREQVERYFIAAKKQYDVLESILVVNRQTNV